MASMAQEVSFDRKLDQLARVAVEVGLGLQRGQELVMTASLDAVPLARRIIEHAYRAGASLVTGEPVPGVRRVKELTCR